MSNEKKKIDCKLNTIGTDKVNKKVIKDLSVSDPDPTVGKQVLGELMEEELKDDSKSTNSE